MGVSFAPAKRAAVWPRPRREPGRWPGPAAPGRRTADLPLLALPACLSTLETKLCPWPLPRFFGALGRTRKSSSRRSVMAALPASSGVSCRAKHADMPALARPSRRTRHGGKAAACCVPPMCRLAFDAARCRVLLSCLPPFPFAVAPGVGGPAANAPMAAGRARPRQDACTLDGCAGCCATCGANAPARQARRHGSRHRNDMPDSTMRCTATCSESAAIMGVPPARSDARRRSRWMR